MTVLLFICISYLLLMRNKWMDTLSLVQCHCVYNTETNARYGPLTADDMLHRVRVDGVGIGGVELLC